ncbi:MAG: hypothetical protein WCI11_06780 [Candidatus Methylumidiphilus sp.]
MPHFDPNRKRHFILSFDLERELELPMEDYFPDFVGNAAVLNLPTVIYGWLCGLQNEVQPLLAKYTAWLENAIEREEHCGDESPAYSSMWRLEAYALCNWLAGNESIKPIYQNIMREHGKYLDELAKLGNLSAKEVKMPSLNDYLRNCFQAGEFATGVDVYESLEGKKPYLSSEEMTEIEFGYWACCQRLDKNWSANKHAEVGSILLQKHLEYDWLEEGQVIQAASWLKMVYWDSGLIRTPLATLLKAYDLMPHVTRPDFTIPAPKDNGGA